HENFRQISKRLLASFRFHLAACKQRPFKTEGPTKPKLFQRVPTMLMRNRTHASAQLNAPSPGARCKAQNPTNSTCNSPVSDSCHDSPDFVNAYTEDDQPRRTCT